MKQIILVLLCWFFVMNVFGQKKYPGEKPKLIIGIVIDQMRYDYIYRYWNKFSEKGFKRLINEGTFCKNANYNYLFTQTGPGHATIFTGANPSVHGIVSNEWYSRLGKKRVYCVTDESVNTVGGKMNNGQYSPKNLFVTTLGDQLKLSDNKKSKVIAISLKERAAILSAGHLANAAYWYDKYTGNWITSTYYMQDLPKWVKEFNKKKYADIYLGEDWNTYLPIEKYTESSNDSTSYEIGFSDHKITFPYHLAEMSQKSNKEKDYGILPNTPYGNTFTYNFAVSTIENEELGQDNNPDMLIVSFSATDYIGHNYGPFSVEMEDAYLRLDYELGTLLNYIDMTIGKENTLIFLTGDHGVMLPPDYLESQKIPAGKFKNYYSMALLKSYLSAIYGEADWIEEYLEQSIYLNHTLIENSKLSLQEFQERTAEFMVQFTGIANAITATTLQNTAFTDGTFKKMQNSFNMKRSGDVLINLQPGWMESGIYVTTHNSGYSYDTHVPLIFYGWKISRATINDPVNITDIVPTIATMLNIEKPNGASGKPISKIINPE